MSTIKKGFKFEKITGKSMAKFQNLFFQIWILIVLIVEINDYYFHDLCWVIGGKHRAPFEALMMKRLMSLLRLITFLNTPQES